MYTVKGIVRGEIGWGGGGRQDASRVDVLRKRDGNISGLV